MNELHGEPLWGTCPGTGDESQGSHAGQKPSRGWLCKAAGVWEGACPASRRERGRGSDETPQAGGHRCSSAPCIAQCKRTAGAAPSLTERNGEFLAVNFE